MVITGQALLAASGIAGVYSARPQSVGSVETVANRRVLLEFVEHE